MYTIAISLAIASIPAVLGLGFFLGLKHATDADHLAAVSTIVSERKSVWSSIIVGGLWGVGHTISLFAAGVLVLLLNIQISERVERGLETCVGIMLAILGLNVLRKLFFGGKFHLHAHEHGGHAHVHPHVHPTDEADDPGTHHGLTLSPRPLIIGMVHGMAGSASLMLLVIPTIDSRLLGLAYIVIFGIGSIGGMMLMSLLVSLPFRLTSFRFTRINQGMQICAGILSLTLGMWIVYEKTVIENLFSL